MEDDETSESSPHSSNEEASPERPSRQAATLPLGLQLASRGAGSAPQSIDPLEIRFSQMKMRHLFGDGRRIADTVKEVYEEPCTEAERAEYGVDCKLIFPFPKIEVIRWRCKIRDMKTGRPKVDNETGEEILDSEEHWFTLDNRRLYCLQEAAMRVWPQRCVAEVAVIISGPHAHMRELRKFRTLDCGRSAMIGSRADGVIFVRWSWREKGGLDESDPEDSGSEADCPPEIKLPHGRKPSKAKEKDQSVLDHLSTLEPDDFERIELSKKISWILRHGAWTSSGRCNNIKISDDGWVLASDMLQVDSLLGLSLKRLLDVVSESNKQKFRYETRETKDGLLIRASGRKGREERSKKTKDAPRDSAATSGGAGKGPGGKAGGKGAESKGNAGGGDKENGKLQEKVQSKPPGILEAKAAPASKATKEARPAPHDKTAVEQYIAAVEARKAEAAAVQSKKKSAPKVPPGAGMDPNIWMATWMRQMAAAGGPFAGLKPPGPLPPPSAMAHLQFMQQMQAMQQMMAAGYVHQMQRAQMMRLMQMRMMRQFQAMQAYQMNAMHEMQHMQAMQEMQSFYESMEWGEEEEEEEDEEGEYEEKLPETAEELEAKLQEVLAASMARFAPEEATPPPKATIASPVTPEATIDLEAKIAEALQAAAARNGATKAAKPKPPPAEVAKPKPARPPPAPAAADMEAKIAEALAAARNRGAAEAAGRAAEAFAKAAEPPKPRPQPKKTKEQDAATSIEDKIAKALEAAKERREAAAK